MRHSLAWRATRHGGRSRARRGALAVATLLCVTCCLGASAAAAATRASFPVSAIVPPYAAIVGSSMPEALDVSSSDVERGFVQVTNVARLVVTSNSREGFALAVLPVMTLFSAVTLQGTGAEVSLDGNGGTIVLRGRRGVAVPLTLGFRFQLAPGTVPGHYPWPLQFGVQPVAALSN